jgi:CRISPR/Cas system-associated endoribonuclease Cas2
MDNDEESFTVNFATGPRYDIEEIRRRKEAFMPDGEHAWVISSVFAVDDPEQAMDEMKLGAENFIGVTRISCLLCLVDYATERRHHKCSQTPEIPQ